MRNPYYWYYNTYCYTPKQPRNYPPQQSYKNENHKRPCMIEDKYCDYFDLGDKAPGFTLDGIVCGDRKKVSLSDYIGKWVVLFFYGSDFTFV